MRKHYSTSILAVALAMTAFTGCNRTGDTETVGEKVDRTTDAVAEKLDNAGEAVSDKAARAGEVVEDAAITTSIKTAMLAEPGLKALKIDVDTKEGTVTLSGTVDSPQNRDRAVEIAQATKGVRYVDNRLTVVAPG